MKGEVGDRGKGSVADGADGVVVLDEELVADTNADAELGGPTLSSDRPADDEILGSRFTLVRRRVEPFEAATGAGIVVVLDAAFQPAPGMRFSNAQVEVSLFMPPGSVFADLAPREVRDSEPVVFTLKSGANLKLGVRRLEADVGHDATTESTHYPCRVVGTGIGQRRVRWTFYENDASRDGIGSHHRLMVALEGEGPFELETITSCSLVRASLAGVPGRLRELILGPHMREGRPSKFVIDPGAVSEELSTRAWYERLPP